MLYLAPVLQKEDKVVRYLVAYNWLSVIQNGVYLPVVMLGITGTFAQGLSNFLAMITLMWVLGITLFVTRKALEVPFGTAAGIVVMDLLLGDYRGADQSARLRLQTSVVLSFIPMSRKNSNTGLNTSSNSNMT